MTPSGVPPIPNNTSAPDCVHAVAMAPATSPSVINRMRAPLDRTSSIRSPWRGRSRITAVTSRTDSPLASAMARRLSVTDCSRLTLPAASGPTASFSM